MTRSTRSAAFVALCIVAASQNVVAQRPGEPVFRFTTSDAFSAASIAPYRGDHAAIYRHIDRNQAAHIAHIQRWIRQPSVSAQNVGIRAMAEMLAGDLRDMGFHEVEIVPTSGHPGVWGFYNADAERTLLVYMMYDVQPVEAEDWTTPPFAAEIADVDGFTVVRGRGATNQKGPERAFLNALSSVLAVEGTLPVNLMILAEGEEELGSPHYPELVDRFEARLRTASGVFFPFNGQDRSGDMSMALGVKGILYFEMEARGGPHGGPTHAEIHGSNKTIVDAPAWRLTQALASLTSADGNTIRVPGYYDRVRAPSPEDQRLVNGLLADWDDARLQRALGVERWIGGIAGREAVIRHLYHPTLNINGMWSGYTGEGVKTILPHVATAKVDSRLPPGFHPDTALALIRAHLNRHGFSDITIRKLSAYPAAQTSVDAPIVRAAISVFRKYGVTPRVSPRLAGSAPFYQFTERLNLPLVFGGLGHGSGAHAPNEFLVIQPPSGSRLAGLAEIEKAYVDLLYGLAGR